MKLDPENGSMKLEMRDAYLIGACSIVPGAISGQDLEYLFIS